MAAAQREGRAAAWRHAHRACLVVLPEDASVGIGRGAAFDVGARRGFVRFFQSSPSDGDGSDAEGGSDGEGAADGDGEGSDGDGDGGSPTPKVEIVSDGGAGNVITPAGPGQAAPRPGHVIALPLRRRPLFPGFILPLTVSDEKLMDTLIKLKKSAHPYVGVFMVKQPEDGAPSGAAPQDSSGSGNRAGGSGFGAVGGGGDKGDDTFLLEEASDIHTMGSFAHIQHLAPVPGGVQAILMSHRRIAMVEPVDGTSPLALQVRHIDDAAPTHRNSDVEKAYANEILATMRDIIKINPMFKEHMQYFTQKLDVNNPYRLADFTASMTTADGEELQAVLNAEDLEERLSRALVLLKKERELSQLQVEISKDVEDKISKNQRQYFLHEQLKSIKRELGMEKDDKDTLLTKFRERLEAVADTIPKEAAGVIEEEMDKLSSLEKNSSEFNVTRTYLDWLTSLPWGRMSDENLDVRAAREILDEDHYGMQDVKDRILEFIAVATLKGSVQGKILCMVGPPGVGKTSIGKSIARALNREFFRFSVGGLSDVAEIKGHRRTYVGAMPGKVIQCLKSTGVSNPLILIDEIDKLGRGYQGDPASALLELLDPNQNASFVDHYLDTPVDCSKILFLVTANVLDTIPGPLLDRMEVIRLSGYDGPEKVEIAKRYLEPKARLESGLVLPAGESDDGSESDANAASAATADADTSGGGAAEGSAAVDGAEGDGAPTTPAVVAPKIKTPPSLRLDDGAIESLIRWYCRESGVRNLEAHISKIYRKAAYKVVVASDEELRNNDWTITKDKLVDYVGKRVFQSDRLYQHTPVGVVTGLAWTSMGGSVLFIEVTSPNYVHPLARSRSAKSTSVGSGADDDIASDSDEAGSSSRGGGGHSLRLTGQAGEVMQESSQIALTVAKHKLRELDPENDFFSKASLHMHVPEGATPKDGPSAGVTMISALLSLARNKPLVPDLAMTGEVSLTGRVLPVGGIKEKCMAARRVGVDTLVLPAANRRDWDELPDYMRDGMEVHFADRYEDVYRIAFGENFPGYDHEAALAEMEDKAAAEGSSTVDESE